MSETPEQHEARIASAYMDSIDEFLDAYDAYAAALADGRRGDTRHHRARLRRAMATFGELVINRADSRTAHMLVDLMRQIAEIREDDHGY